MDINALKQGQINLDETRGALEFAEAVIATRREPLLVLTGDLRVRIANRSFHRAFGVSPDVTQDRPLYALGNGQWDVPALRAALAGLAWRGTPFEGLRVEHEDPEFGRRRLNLRGRRLDSWAAAEPLFRLAVEEIAPPQV